MTSGPISREELLSGRLPRQRGARRIVGAIESRVLYMRDETRRALQAYFLSDFSEYQRGLDSDYFTVVQQRARSDTPLLAADLERFVPQWRMLLPGAAEARAAVLRTLLQSVALTPGNAPDTLRELGYEDEAVRTAHLEAYGEPPQYSSETPRTSEESAPRRDAATSDMLRTVEDRADWVTVPGGTRLFAAGEPSDALYLVISGRFRVTQADGKVIAEIGRGEAVGEMGALTGEPRSADVIAARDSEAVRIPQALLMEVAATSPEVLLRINHDLVARLRNTTARTSAAPEVSTYAIVAAGPDAPVRDAARWLAAAIGHIGPTTHITYDEVKTHANTESNAALPVFTDPELIAWLAEQESSYRYVIYEADAELTPWTRRCIRQADRILLVANGDADPEPGAIDDEIAAAGSRPPVELLLVHPASTERPAGTARWLNCRELEGHHHLRRDDESQIRHIARMVTGTGLGVAFGGGGARGAAHIGVVRALEERGIEIDVIGGTSMGALVGGMFAEGWSAAEVARQLTDVTTNQRLLDWTLPIVAFTAGERANQILFKGFGRVHIEDLWRPFFCVSTDLTRAEAVVHRRGSLWTAVRASISIPGVFPPVPTPDGGLLVDGGIMNTLPIDLVRQARGVGTVIGSNVTPDREASSDASYSSGVSGWRVALSRLPGTGDRIETPSIVSTMIRANEVRGVAMNRTTEFAAQADLIIQPPVEQFPTLDFKRSAELTEIGYRAGNEALTGWDKTETLVRLNAPRSGHEEHDAVR